MPQAELQAHSLAEADLYLQAIACPKCGSGPVASIHAEDETPDAGGSFRRTEVGLCAACGAEHHVVFRIPAMAGHPGTDTLVVNPGENPSRIIDLGQWITLARVFIERTAKSADPRHVRRLNLQAAQCLNEALKFYDDSDNDLPSHEAFFYEPSRERFRTHPQQFSRQRLLHERSKLPTTSTSPTRDDATGSEPGGGRSGEKRR